MTALEAGTRLRKVTCGVSASTELPRRSRVMFSNQRGAVTGRPEGMCRWQAGS